MDEQVYVNLVMPMEMDLDLRRLAAERRISKSELVRIAIGDYLAQYRIVSVETLPRPEGSTPVPLVKVVRET